MLPEEDLEPCFAPRPRDWQPAMCGPRGEVCILTSSTSRRKAFEPIPDCTGHDRYTTVTCGFMAHAKTVRAPTSPPLGLVSLTSEGAHGRLSRRFSERVRSVVGLVRLQSWAGVGSQFCIRCP